MAATDSDETVTDMMSSPTHRASRRCALSIGLVLLLAGDTRAQGSSSTTDPTDTAALAKATQNPVAPITTIPFQVNFNSGGDLEAGSALNVNVQPVIPFRLTEGINVIARTIVPISSVPGPEATRYTGVGDVQAQVFFTPARAGALTWGVGPVVSLPTATALPFETGTFAMGVGGVLVRTVGPFVLGGLVSQYWPVSDAGDGVETNLLTAQPFVNYNFGAGWALSFAPLLTANWDARSGDQWTVPLGIGLVRTTVFDGRPMNLGVQYYRNVERPAGSAGFQLRFSITLLYPQRPR